MTHRDEILVALRRITRAIDLHSKWLMKETGLTSPQLVVLHLLRREGAVPPSQIAKSVSLSQATISSILDRLQRAGLIDRQRSPKDGRVMLAALTDKGMAAIEHSPELLQSAFLDRFRTLQPWEQQMLIASLQRIAELMDAEDLDASPILESGEIDAPRDR
jgi:DNA-binding MarR family transcriptional regulator